MKLIGFGLLAAVAMMTSGPASAATVKVHFSGTLSSAENFQIDDIPPRNFFAVGQEFEGDVEYNDDLIEDTFSDNSYNYIDKFSFTIGGEEFGAFYPAYKVIAYPDGTIDLIDGVADSFGNGGLHFTLAPGSMPTATTLNGKHATFSFVEYDPQGGRVSGDATVSAVAVGTVPEPSLWALMIVGFGLIGGMTRQRRSTVASAGCHLVQPDSFRVGIPVRQCLTRV
jgi:hypothetical protein